MVRRYNWREERDEEHAPSDLSIVRYLLECDWCAHQWESLGLVGDDGQLVPCPECGHRQLQVKDAELLARAEVQST